MNSCELWRLIAFLGKDLGKHSGIERN